MMYSDDDNKKFYRSKMSLASFVFVLFFVVQSWASEGIASIEFVSADVHAQNTANWQQILTQNAGVLSLPSGWDVVSKDDPTERKLDAERMFHVQQVLYAKSKKLLEDQGASLQIFSIWNADKEGKILPLPSDILENTSRNLVAALIDARYGNVRTLTREVVETDLENLFVTTYGVESLGIGGNSEDQYKKEGARENLRYKCASLFYGEKLILVLVKYFPTDEGYWRRELETLLDTWVATLTFTPRPLAEMSEAAVSLPALPVSGAPEADPLSIQAQPVFTPSLDISSADSAVVVSQEDSGLSLAAASSEDIAVSPGTTTVLTPQKNPISSFVLYGGFVLAAFVIFSACIGRIFDCRRKRQEDALLTDLVPEKTEVDTAAATEESAESQDTEKNLDPGIFVEILSASCEEGDDSTEKPCMEESYIEEPCTEESYREEDHDKELDLDWAKTDELISPPIDDVHDFEMREPLSEKLGFDRVYSLLNQALVSIDTTQAVTTHAIPDTRVREPARPNLADAVGVLDNLQAAFGESFLLETLKEEVLKALELKEGTPILQTKDMAPEYFVLKLCCNTLLNMLQTGRYHIGKGILSNEGQELVNLFGHINGLRTREAYSSREEAEKDAAFMQFCIRELG
jgi:hypothetical protein